MHEHWTATIETDYKLTDLQRVPLHAAVWAVHVRVVAFEISPRKSSKTT